VTRQSEVEKVSKCPVVYARDLQDEYEEEAQEERSVENCRNNQRLRRLKSLGSKRLVICDGRSEVVEKRDEHGESVRDQNKGTMRRYCSVEL
jgi:hypothetical protein